MRKLIFKGKAWIFGDKIDTDVITSGKYLSLGMEEMSKHALETVNPRFAKEVRSGDIIVARDNFGCGSSRETAPAVLKYLGIGAIVAQSFARIFFRNALAIGLPVLSCNGVVHGVKDGEEISVDFEETSISNLTTGVFWKANQLSQDMLKVLQGGGIVPLMKKMVENRSR